MLYKNKIVTKSWIEISRKNLIFNLNQIKKIVDNKKIACVVKANAYGHGLEEIVSILKKEKNIIFAVDSLKEALTARKIEKQKEILILGYLPLNQLEITVKNEFSFIVYNLESLQEILSLKTNKKAKIYLKIETGLNRQGIKEENLEKFLNLIKKNKDKIVFEGVSTHFANIEDTINPDFAMKQLNNFEKVIQKIEKEGIDIPFKHCAASAAIILYPQTHFNLIRLGISLYGLWPSKEVFSLSQRKIVLKPVLTWKTIVAQIKEIKKGETVGYGRTWQAFKKVKIAIIPIGYFDGYDRKLSNVGRVLIKGKFCKVIGRIAMNMFMVDVTNLKNICLEDEVVLIGRMGNNEITAEELAEKTGTINYEIIARINPGLPKIII